MKSRCQIRITSGSFAFLAVVVLACGIAVAQSANLQGVISGRSGNTLTLRTNSGNVTVVLTPDTQVDEVQGVFHARKKQDEKKVYRIAAYVGSLKTGTRE